ncbi:unnamed protein product [Closterium sp. NIES-53]
MALLRVLAFDHEGRPNQFDTWLDDLQLYLLSESKDSVSLFDLASGTATAPPATANSATHSQWLTRDAAARLAIRNHLPLAECAHFGKHGTAQALYDAVVARYSSPATTALGRLLLPYLFPELSAFATVEDLVSHLRASDVRYRATVPAEFLDKNPPPMFITLYFIVTRLLDSLRSVMDHFLSLDPTSLTVDLLKEHLLAAETSAVAISAARGTLRTPFFEGCSPSHLATSYASAATADVRGAEDVGAASASEKRCSSKSKGGGGGGGGSKSGGGDSVGGSGGGGGGGGGGTGGGDGGSSGGGGGSGGSGGSGSGGTGGGRTGARCGGSGGGQRQQQQRRSETQLPQQLCEWLFKRGTSRGSDSCPYVIRTGDRAGHACGRLHTQHSSFSRLDDVWRAEFGDEVKRPHWADMHSIEAAALGASESGTLPGTAPAKALHTFTLDSSASRSMAPMQPSLGPPRDEPRVFGLDKFNGDNFAEWSFKMENIFDHNDLLEVMEGTEKHPENDPEKSPWVRKSAQGYLLLGQALGSSQIRHIKPFQREPEKGPKAWAALKGVHAPATAAVAVVLERQMVALRIEEDDAVEEGVQKLFDLLTRLEGADLNYSQEGRGAGGGRGRGRGGRGGSAASMKSAGNESESRDDRFPGQFFFVSTQALAGPERDESFEEPAAVGKVTLHSLDYWVIDSSATYSMTPRADLLTELEPSSVKHVTSALGQQAEVKGMGKAMFKGADGKMVGLKNVLWVPKLAANLISVRRLQKAGMDTSSKGARTYTARLGERIIWDLHKDRDVYNEMWQIPVVPMPKERQVAASISTKGEAVGSGDGANGRAKEMKSKKCNLGGTSKLGEHEESGAAARKQHKGEENPKAAAQE